MAGSVNGPDRCGVADDSRDPGAYAEQANQVS
jgi:hypothetical protein